MALSKRFFRQATVMMTGTALAQAIPLLVAPLLTRLYSPAQFGAASAIIAASAIAAIIASFRYELAILLPRTEADAVSIVGLAFGCATLISLVLFLLAVCFPDLIFALWKRSDMRWGEVVLLTFAIASTQVLNFAATRERRFRWIASSLVAQQALTAFVAIIIGTFSTSTNGLIAGRLAGQFCAAILLFFVLLPWLRAHAKSVRFESVRRLARTYRQFPQFNVPYSFLGTFSRELLILSFTALGQSAAAGQYGLARSLLAAPVGFLSSSLSQVFFREATDNLGTPAFRHLTIRLLVGIAAMLTPLFVLGWLWAPIAFEIIFGAQWREAGEYAAKLLPMVFLSLFTSWPERVFEVSGRQRYSLVMQLVFDSVSIGVVLLALRSGVATHSAITLYVSIQLVYQLTYLAAVFHLSKLSSGLFFGFLTFLLGLISLSIAVLLPLTQIAPPTLTWLFGLIVCALALGAGALLVSTWLTKWMAPLTSDAHQA